MRLHQAPFRDDFSPIDYPHQNTRVESRYDQPTIQLYLPNLNSLSSPTIRRYERRYKISKIGWFGVVRGHWRSLKIAPFDRAHTSSYSLSIVTICPYLAPFLWYSEILVENRLFESTPLYYLTPQLGWPVGNSSRSLAPEYQGIPGLTSSLICVILSLVILVHCRLVTDRRTDGHTITAYTALRVYGATSRRSRGNNSYTHGAYMM